MIDTVKSITLLEDLKQRVALMIEINQNSLEMGELSHIESVGLEYQNIGFASVLVLIDQLVKRGSIWKGGYLDDIGVVYEDQLKTILQEQKAHRINQELDNRLALAIADD